MEGSCAGRSGITPAGVGLFTFNINPDDPAHPLEPKNPFQAHAVVLAAYDAETRQFGFLNSGFLYKERQLTWISEDDIRRLTTTPVEIFIRPHFVVITVEP